MQAELLLTPLEIVEFTPSHAHGHVVDYVEDELAHPATTLVYVDSRGARDIYHTLMTFKRPIGTLPARHLFVLKWLRMMEFSGLLPRIAKAGYYDYIAQSYVGILHADGKASVTFHKTKQGGSWLEANHRMLHDQCLDYYTPSFDDVFSDAVTMIQDYTRTWPDTPMADFGRRHLEGGASGWATAR